MYTIRFYVGNSLGPVQQLMEFTDEEIELSRASLESRIGPLLCDPKTGFPSFVVYLDGQEVGGG
jgi:hypothetical protein